MTIKWKIVKKNPEQGCVEVLWHDEATGTVLGPYNCNVLDEAGAPKSGQALIDAIDGATPVYEFSQAAKLAALPATAMDHIDALIDVEHVANLNVFVTQAQNVQVSGPCKGLEVWV